MPYSLSPRGETSGCVALHRGRHRIAVFYPEATDDEIQACLDTLTDRDTHGQPRQVG